jgi:hypothetical protein
MKSVDFVERRIVRALITSNDYTKKLAPQWRDDFLDTPELQTISGWCIDYYRQYSKVPGRQIEDIFMREMTTNRLGGAEAEVIEAILSLISDDYEHGEEINADFLFDRTIEYLRGRQLRLVGEDVDIATKRGDFDRAERLLRDFKPGVGQRKGRRADTIKPKPTRWHWNNVIPWEELVLIAGWKGLGKLQITTWIAAMASTGRAWPGGKANRPRDVVMMSAEDSVEQIIVPRLMANRADRSRISILPPAEDTEQVAQWIEAELEQLPGGGRGAIVMLDPVSSFMGSGKDPNNVAHVRRALRPLVELGWRRHVTVIVVHHLRKALDGRALDLVMGSAGFTHAARVVHLVFPDPEQSHRNLLLHGANNLGAAHPGYAYQIVPESVGVDGIDTTALAFDPTPVERNADQVLAMLRKAKSQPSRSEAKTWLRELLTPGPMAQNKVKEMALDAGHGWWTVRQAKTDLRVESTRQGNRHDRYLWSLPAD